MGIQSPAELAKDADMLQTQCQKLIDEAKKQLSTYKKHAAEFETIRGGLLEGSSAIVEHQKELVTMFATFDKMTSKLEGIRKNLVGDGTTLRAVQKQIVAAIPDGRELSKDADKLIPINKGNALLLNAKKDLVTLDTQLVDMKEKLEVAAGDCEGLPGDVAKPKA